MKLGNLSLGEFFAMAGGVLLGVSIFLPHTYEPRPQNRHANINGLKDGVFSIWEVHPIMRWFLLAGAGAPFILAYIVIREHELSWPRGEATAVVAIAVMGLIFYTGIIDRPGEPSGEIELDWSWYTAMGGGLAMLIGAAMRQSRSETRRKPPGVL